MSGGEAVRAALEKWVKLDYTQFYCTGPFLLNPIGWGLITVPPTPTTLSFYWNVIQSYIEPRIDGLALVVHWLNITQCIVLDQLFKKYVPNYFYFLTIPIFMALYMLMYIVLLLLLLLLLLL